MEGQNTSVNIQSMAASQIGMNAASYTDANGNTQQVYTQSLADVNVSTFKGAQDAIAVVDKAISDVSTVSANLGALQTDTLQSNITSLGVATANLQASQSTIQDTDMASQIVDYTKNQILVQASTSALAYANQMPQSVLKLLQ
jgi:flagellin